MMVVCGSGLKWSDESLGVLSFLIFFLDPMGPPVLSLSLFGRLRALSAPSSPSLQLAVCWWLDPQLHKSSQSEDSFTQSCTEGIFDRNLLVSQITKNILGTKKIACV